MLLYTDTENVGSFHLSSHTSYLKFESWVNLWLGNSVSQLKTYSST